MVVHILDNTVACHRVQLGPWASVVYSVFGSSYPQLHCATCDSSFSYLGYCEVNGREPLRVDDTFRIDAFKRVIATTERKNVPALHLRRRVESGRVIRDEVTR